MKKYSVFLFIVSSIFSACTERSTNTEIASEPSRTYSANSNAMMSSNSSMMSMEVKKDDGFDQTSGERYTEIDENPFLETSRAPLSTFSVDVDTAAYSNVRRYLNDGQMPPRDAVRIEELINYFEYDYPQPVGDLPFSVNTEVAACAWNSRNKIVSIGLQGKKVSLEDAPSSNLVFLVDVSGSMNKPARLPLVKQGLKFLAQQLSTKDRVAIVVYAGKSGLVLPSTGDEREILDSLDKLEAGGSTNGGEGIQLAYKVALDNFLADGNNRVILATDGDFNVGLQSDDELVRLIEAKRRSGIFLSVLGFGTGNTNDSMMEKLADKGNGNYAYIDSQAEARKALGEQAAETLLTIAKDVKIQVEFNPAKIAGYRLIGYENRLLANKDFKDDRKDAGDIGAGHSVTALYEIVPAGQTVNNEGIELKYSKTEASESNFGDELLTVKLRYKEPNADESKLLTQGLLDEENSIENASANLRFASAVAGFGLILRDSRYKGNASYGKITQLAQDSLGSDLKNYRSDFLDMVMKANIISN
jgi:Ca-activated chloride channel family protein